MESTIFLRKQAFLRAELRILQPWNCCRLSSRLRYSRLSTQRSVLVEACVDHSRVRRFMNLLILERFGIHGSRTS